jgi:putative FmdB family regulatory protein
MAVYEYYCLNCGHIMKKTHAINITMRNMFCSSCNQWSRVKRLISRSTFILRGLGWGSAGYQKEKNNAQGG